MQTIQKHFRYAKAELIEAYLERIVRAYDPKRVWLIGSAARGTNKEHSDLDFVVESDTFIDPDEVIGAIDIIPYHHITDAMAESLESEGVLLYEKR